MSVTPARRPRFLPFIVTGAVLGFLLGGALAAFGWFEDPDPVVPSNYPASAVVGYLGFLGALVVGLAAAVLAIAPGPAHRQVLTGRVGEWRSCHAVTDA